MIDHYLANELVQPKDPPAQATRELQIDSLYLLTDRDRHRRACSAVQIADEMKQIRPSELYPARPEPEAVTAALQPLVRYGLLRAIDTARENPDFELAHDFAVRAAVQTWRQLDHRRARDLGRAARERERKEERLQHLEARNETTTLILQIAPLVGLVGLIWAALKLYGGDPSALGINPAEARPGLLVFAAFSALLAAGAIARHRMSIIMSALAIVVAVMTMIWIGDARSATTQAYLAISEEAIQFARSIPVDEHPAKSLAQRLSDSTKAVATDGKSTVLLFEYYVQFNRLRHSDEYSERIGSFAEDLDRWNSYLNVLERKIQLAGVFLLLVSASLFVLCVRSEASLLPEGNPWRRSLLVMWGELLDMATYAPAIAMAWIGLERPVEELWYLMAASTAAVVLGVRQFLMRKLHSTPGLRLAGVFVELPAAEERIMRTLFRELLLLVWSILNVVLLIPWLLGALHIRATGRTIVDRIARTQLVDIKKTNPEAPQASLEHAAA